MPYTERELSEICRSGWELYRVSLTPEEVRECLEQIARVLPSGSRDADTPTAFVRHFSRRAHDCLAVGHVLALALCRVRSCGRKMAVASTVADLLDGAIQLDRQAYARAGDFSELQDEYREHRDRYVGPGAGGTSRARAKAQTTARARRPDRPPAPPGRGVEPTADDLHEADLAAGAPVTPRIVTYRRLDSGDTRTVFLAPAGLDTPDSGVRLVPIGSPLGKALRDAAAGESVFAVLGGTEVELEVLAVDPTR